MKNQPKTSCPICDKANTWSLDNPSRPFCSPRCKLIDLGEWVSEKRTIAGSPVSPDLSLDEDFKNLEE